MEREGAAAVRYRRAVVRAGPGRVRDLGSRRRLRYRIRHVVPGIDDRDVSGVPGTVRRMIEVQVGLVIVPGIRLMPVIGFHRGPKTVSDLDDQMRPGERRGMPVLRGTYGRGVSAAYVFAVADTPDSPGAGTAPAIGRLSTIVRPPPGVSSAFRVPPMASVKPRATARPRPTPAPRGESP